MCTRCQRRKIKKSDSFGRWLSVWEDRYHKQMTIKVWKVQSRGGEFNGRSNRFCLQGRRGRLMLELGDLFTHCHSVLFIAFFFSFSFYSVTVVCIFSPSLHPTPAEPTSLPNLHPPPWFCPCVLYSSSCKPLSPLSSPHFPLAIVRLFLTSMSLVIFCFLFSFVDYVPLKGEII